MLGEGVLEFNLHVWVTKQWSLKEETSLEVIREKERNICMQEREEQPQELENLLPVTEE